MNEASTSSDFSEKNRCKKIIIMPNVQFQNKNTGEEQLTLTWRGEVTVKAYICP